MLGATEATGMIANDYQLEVAKAELAKSRRDVADLDAILSVLPKSIAAQVSAHRPAAIRQRIRELEAEIQRYTTAPRGAALTVPHV